MPNPTTKKTGPEPDATECRSIEQQALRLSPLGYCVFGLLGLVFFLLTHSEAILLDGVYSLISLTMALLAARVSQLVHLPGSRRFHFGYAHFEPILNTLRIALILGVDAFALFSAIDAIFTGGRTLNTGIAVIYGILSAVACLTMSALQRRAARKIDSPMLRVDARNWMIDGMISSGVGLAFLAGFVLQRTALSSFVPYIDPIVVIVIVLASLPITFRSVRENVPQLLAVAPAPELQAAVRERIESVLEDFENREISIRIIQIGRFFYLLVHVIVSKETENLNIHRCDHLRRQINENLAEILPHQIVDVIFTADDQDVLRIDPIDEEQ